MGNKNTNETPRFKELQPGFFNIRTSFKAFKGLLDIGTHMTLIRLNSGGFLVIDTVPLDHEIKAYIDAVTDHGKNIVAVIATHPFHTLAFPAFYEAYPNCPYIGTPRHIKNIKSIPWDTQDVMSEEVRNRWAPEVEMRIPAGAEFRAPQPESTNHFNSVWVYHRPSGSLHIDDTVMYFENPGTIFKLAGKHHNQMEFHMSINGPGLYSAPDAPATFKAWVESVLNDWEFDNICTAHVGRKIGGAKEALADTLKNSDHIFKKLEKHHQDKMSLADLESQDVDPQGCASYNVDGNECG